MTDLELIRPRLDAALASQRVVLWDDFAGEYSEAIDSLTLADVSVIRVAQNEFGLKVRVLIDSPDERFLLYRASLPEGEDWLLDIKLTYGSFRADRVSGVLDTHDLDPEVFESLVAEYPEFFRANKRVDALKSRLAPDDSPDQIRAKMSAVLGGSKVDHRLTDIMRTLLQEKADGRDTFVSAIRSFGLESFLWQGADRIYGYRTATPSVDDFAIWMFERANEGFTPTIDPSPPSQSVEHRQLSIDFSAWKAAKSFEDAYGQLSLRAADALDVTSTLDQLPVDSLLDNFLYEAVDQRIIRILAAAVAEQTIPHRDVEHISRSRLSERRGTRFEAYYRALEAASGLLSEVTSLKWGLGTFEHGVTEYATTWFRVDQRYRQFYTHARHDKHDVLKDLSAKVESVYVFDYLHPQGLSWQQQVDAVDAWPQPTRRAASRFFADHVKLAIGPNNRKIAVIISDGFRYEIADELRSQVLMGDKFDATIEPLVGVLPSFTQLGMATLLPHGDVVLQEDGFVTIDGKPTKGTANREGFLAPQGGRAVRATDLLKMSRDETRDLIASCRILYIYHDTIDATGDKPTTEGNVFRAAEDAISDILDLTRKLTTEGLSNILVTADHGFQYQENGLEPQGYLDAKPAGSFVNRRFVIGKGLEPNASLVTFTSDQLGLAGDVEVQIPKSTHRIVKPGAGTRYVHGGASLQEIIVPLVTINKARRSDTRQVAVQLLPERDTITTGQLIVKVNQVDPVTEKIQPRTLRIGIFADETLISNEIERPFELTSPDALQRVVNVQLLLSRAADTHEGETVEVRLRERVGSTNHWKTYVSAPYKLKRAMLADF